jgi:peptidoglycan/xylan/chitin deacetylase (PgdA/CDA1 family)
VEVVSIIATHWDGHRDILYNAFTYRSVPGAFGILSPYEGESEVPLEAMFDWEDAPFAETYALVVSPNADLTGVVIDESTLTDSEYTALSGDLLAKTTYYWAVTAQNPHGSSECGGSFATDGPPVIVSTDPADGDVTVTTVTVSVVFDEPMDTGSVESAFSLTCDTGSVNCAPIWLADDKEVVLTPNAPLVTDKTYTVTIADTAVDVDGNALDGDDDGVEGGHYSFEFTTTEFWGGGTSGALTVTISTSLDPGNPYTSDATLDTVTVTVDGGAGPYTVTLTGAGAKTQASPVPFTDVPLVEGTNSLVATVTDADSGFDQASVTVILDTTPPEVEILLPHRIASGHLRDADGWPVLIAGPKDIERVRDTDSAVSHRTKRNVIGLSTGWRIRTAEDRAPITSAKILSIPADPDDGNPVPPLPPSAWDYLNMPLEAHPSPGDVPETGGDERRMFSLAPGTHMVTSPVSMLGEGQYWIIAEVVNVAGGTTRVGGLVYVDKSRPDTANTGSMAYGLVADTVTLSVDGSSENTYGYADRESSNANTGWFVYPQLEFQEPPDYGDDYVGLSEPARKTFALHAQDYAGNRRSYSLDVGYWWASDRFFAASTIPTADDNWYFSFENAWEYDENLSGFNFLHFTQNGEFSFTYKDADDQDTLFAGHMVPGTIGVRIDGVASPSGTGIVPAPPAWPLDGLPPEDVEVSLVGDFLHFGLSDLASAKGNLSLSSDDSPNYSAITVASDMSATAVTEGSGPGDDDVVTFDGEWVSDDTHTNDRAYHQAAGWEWVYAWFGGVSGANKIDVALDTTRPGMMNVVRAGPSVMATGSRVTLRVVAGGLEDLSVSDLASDTSVNVWLRKDGEQVDPDLPDTYTRAKDENGNVLPARVVTFDLANQRRYKALEIDLDLSPELDVGVYDVEVKAGAVVAVDQSGRNASDYPVGDRWYGDNDGLIVERAVNVLNFETVVRSPTGETVPAELIPESDPAPTVTLDPLATGDFTITSEGYVSGTLSGVVHDAAADVIADGTGDIAALKVYCDGNLIESVSLLRDSAPPSADPWRQNAYTAHFTTSVSFSVEHPVQYDIEVRTTENVVGNTGYDIAVLRVDLDSDGGFVISDVENLDGSGPGTFTPMMVRAKAEGDFLDGESGTLGSASCGLVPQPDGYHYFGDSPPKVFFFSQRGTKLNILKPGDIAKLSVGARKRVRLVSVDPSYVRANEQNVRVQLTFHGMPNLAAGDTFFITALGVTGIRVSDTVMKTAPFAAPATPGKHIISVDIASQNLIVALADAFEVGVDKELTIFLTFDDGPSANTDTVLNALQQKGVNATFFVQTHAPSRGNTTLGRARLLRMVSEGHSVQIHTWSDADHVVHPTRLLAPAYDADGDNDIDADDGANGLESDLIRAKLHIMTVTGQPTVKLVRPPEYNLDGAGKVVQSYTNCLLKAHIAEFQSMDTSWSYQKVKALMNSTTRNRQTYGVPVRLACKIFGNDLSILFHDINSTTASHMGDYIEEIEKICRDNGRRAIFAPMYEKP